MLTPACTPSDGAGEGPIDLGTASSSPSSTGPDPVTSSVPTTGATGSTSTGSSADVTSTSSAEGSATDGAGTTTVELGTSSSGTTEAIPSPSCGDAVVDAGEECDLGAENDDQGACTVTCKLAKCGDKLIWAGKENCDNGANNNDSLYGGCTTKCQYGPRCSDGVLQGPEECDLGADNGTDEFPAKSVPCDDGCRFDARLVFISSVLYKGGDIQGAVGADQKCQELASAALFDNAGNFKAWISDAEHSPAKDFIKVAGQPYVRLDGVRIADDWEDLIENGPEEGIILTETAETMLSKGVWTGTGPGGSLAPDTLTCQGWTSSGAADKGHRGLSGVDNQGPAWDAWIENKQWTSYTQFVCLNAYSIYCFEQ